MHNLFSSEVQQIGYRCNLKKPDFKNPAFIILFSCFYRFKQSNSQSGFLVACFKSVCFSVDVNTAGKMLPACIIVSEEDQIYIISQVSHHRSQCAVILEALSHFVIENSISKCFVSDCIPFLSHICISTLL